MNIVKQLFALFVFVLLSTTLYAQNNLKANLFEEYETLIDDLRKQNGEILAPENFKNAVKYFKRASEDYDSKDESLIEIKKNLERSREYALKAEEFVKLANVTLQKAIKARDDALNASAPMYAEDDWEESEKKLRQATVNLEDNDLEDAQKYGARAYDMYKRTELLAIKNGILNDARMQIRLAGEAGAEEICYHTFRDAQNLLAEAEELITSDRYAKEQAIRKARQAAYQGRHAVYLANTIKELSKKNENWEYLILKYEEILSNLGALFNYTPAFDEGFDPAVKALMAHIRNLKEEEQRLLEENNSLEDELNRLRETEASVSAELKIKRAREKKIEKVKDIFSPDEAEVVYLGDKLTIRLVGLSFQVGRAIIQPEYFSLLTKVERAIREFPDSYIIIEGHTDAIGNARKNKTLSEQRAAAVKEYLLANMELADDQIEHYGLGDQKPIASNKTAEGRARNRRIDVIISLDR